MNFSKYIAFNLKRPVLSEHELTLEKRKERIKNLFKYCEYKYRTFKHVIRKLNKKDIKNISIKNDVLIRFELLILDLLNLAFSIHGKTTSKEFPEAVRRKNKISNPKVSQHLLELINLCENWKSKEYRIKNSRETMERIVDDLFFELDQFYQKIKKEELSTQYTEYIKHLKTAMVLIGGVLVIVAVIVIYISTVNWIHYSFDLEKLQGSFQKHPGKIRIVTDTRVTTERIAIRKSKYLIVIKAMSEKVADENARLKIYLGENLIADYYTTEKYENKIIPVDIERNRKLDLGIEFCNDYYELGVADRNVWIKGITITNRRGWIISLSSYLNNFISAIPEYYFRYPLLLLLCIYLFYKSRYSFILNKK